MNGVLLIVLFQKYPVCEKRKCSIFVENNFAVKFCMVFMAVDADKQNGGKLKNYLQLSSD